MTPFLTAEYFNPSSMYEPARPTAHAHRRRPGATIARFFGLADPNAILLTSLRLGEQQHGDFRRGQGQSGPPPRHHDGRRASGRAGSLQGTGTRGLRRDLFGRRSRRATSTLGEFIRALRPDTLLVTIMHANNETGVIFPIEQLSRLTKETDPSILFHTDATQSVGKLPIDLRTASCSTSTCCRFPATSFTRRRASARCT